MINLTNISEPVKIALQIAQLLAKEHGHAEFGGAHLLKGLLNKSVGMRGFLLSSGKDESYLREWAKARIESQEKTAHIPGFIPPEVGIKRTFEEADQIRIQLGLDLIVPFCVLAALAKPGIAFTDGVLKTFPIKEGELLDLYIPDEQQLPVTRADTSQDQLAFEQSVAWPYPYFIKNAESVRPAKGTPVTEKDISKLMAEYAHPREMLEKTLDHEETWQAFIGALRSFINDFEEINNNKRPGISPL